MLLAPSADSLVPMQAECVYNPRKLQPRGAAERQDFADLRAFLDDNPATGEDKVAEHEPKSCFEWGDSDGDSDFQVSKPYKLERRLGKQQQQTSGRNENDGKGHTFGNGGNSSMFEGRENNVNKNLATKKAVENVFDDAIWRRSYGNSPFAVTSLNCFSDENMLAAIRTKEQGSDYNTLAKNIGRLSCCWSC